ncbi:MAG: DUF1275 domain-containing protein, partial [Actinobacteria bacterium]|nr:DUF1275 domain-containing protein [Actinomycetota bacterium]
MGWASVYLRDPKHGPLPALLIVLTVATGAVDAVSIIALGRVFVANMTGNIAFIGFALAGAPGFSLRASLVALAAFLVGAALGGALITWHRDRHRMGLLRITVAAEVVLLGTATAVIAPEGHTIGSTPRDVAVALAALALGLQNATVRRLAVPDLTTTVLTMTLTGIASDLHAGNVAVAIRRLLAVAAMLLGAAASGLWGAGDYPYVAGQVCTTGPLSAPLTSWDVGGAGPGYLVAPLSSNGVQDSGAPPLSSAGVQQQTSVTPGTDGFTSDADIGAYAALLAGVGTTGSDQQVAEVAGL